VAIGPLVRESFLMDEEGGTTSGLKRGRYSTSSMSSRILWEVHDPLPVFLLKGVSGGGRGGGERKFKG